MAEERPAAQDLTVVGYECSIYPRDTVDLFDVYERLVPWQGREELLMDR